MTDFSSMALSREHLRTTWNQATGRVEVKDPVLRNAIKNPRIAKPYGSDTGDHDFEEIGTRGVDSFIKLNRNGDARTIRAATS
jgi:hypothetical protein